MTRKRLILVPALIVVAAAIVGAIAAFASGSDQAGLSSAKTATARFRDVDAAMRAGYAELRDAKKIACIVQPGSGGMGIHYVNQALVGDAVVDPNRPEALVYDPSPGGLKLAALEYIVFAKAWKSSTPPALFGRTFDYVAAGNRYGLPAFWALHAWVWRTNPAGAVMAWNPRVSCR